MTNTIQKSLALLLVTLSAALMTAGCATTSSTVSGTDYLASLKSDHRLDAKALKVCRTDSGVPPTQPLVAADSTLTYIRSLDFPGPSVEGDDPNLHSNKKGYAAICLIGVTLNGQHLTIWEYALPNRESGTIAAGS